MRHSEKAFLQVAGIPLFPTIGYFGVIYLLSLRALKTKVGLSYGML
jgi:hypothetical protein